MLVHSFVWPVILYTHRKWGVSTAADSSVVRVTVMTRSRTWDRKNLEGCWMNRSFWRMEGSVRSWRLDGSLPRRKTVSMRSGGRRRAGFLWISEVHACLDSTVVRLFCSKRCCPVDQPEPSAVQLFLWVMSREWEKQLIIPSVWFNLQEPTSSHEPTAQY